MPASLSSQYELADCIIESELPLPELRRVCSGQSAWRVVLSTAAAPKLKRPFHFWNAVDGRRWATFARDGERLIMHFARTAAFVVDPKSRDIDCHSIGRTSNDALRPVLLNQLFPLLFGSERLVLHASAVATRAGALVFVGPPGAGKSTLAAALALRGLPLVSDDFLIVDESNKAPHAVPSKVEPRLWPDSVVALLGERRHFPVVGQRTSKRRIGPPAAAGFTLAQYSIPIHKVFLLSPTATHDRLSPASTLSALTACAFITRVDEAAVARETFERVAALMRRVRVVQLGPVHDFGALRGLCDILCEAPPLPRCG